MTRWAVGAIWALGSSYLLGVVAGGELQLEWAGWAERVLSSALASSLGLTDPGLTREVGASPVVVETDDAHGRRHVIRAGVRTYR